MDKIQNYYNEYKKFINNKELPEINPIIKDDKNDIFPSYAYIDRECLEAEPIPLYVSSKLLTYKEQFYKSILYHEFTHIFDYHISFSGMDKETKNKLMAIYSEYHASQIEILANLGYTRAYNVLNRFDMGRKLVSENEVVDVENYLLFPLSSSLTVIDNDAMAYFELSNFEYSKKYAQSLANVIYYLGKFSICEKYANSKPFNFFHEFGEFEEDIKMLYSYLKLKKYKDILVAENNYRMHFFDYFKFK